MWTARAPCRQRHRHVWFFFLFNGTAAPEIYTLSLHDALPISARTLAHLYELRAAWIAGSGAVPIEHHAMRSEEHTSELQSRRDLVCRLLLEKKKSFHSVVSV